MAFSSGSARTEIHQAGNRIDAVVRKAFSPVPAEWDLFAGAYAVRSERFAFPPVGTDTAETACVRVLQSAGASRSRDAADRAIVRSVTAKSGALIDSPKQVGGWPRLRTRRSPADTDGDGMPDAWEAANGLDPRNPADGAALAGAGASNLETYLDELSRAVGDPPVRGK